MRRTVLLTAAAGTAAVMLGLAPAAATAAPVVYAYAWDGGALIEYTDPIAGIGEVVPTTTAAFAVTGLDVDSSGVGYAVSYDGESHLFSVDVVTGDVADLGVLTFNAVPVVDCTGLDYTGGVLTVVCDFVDGQSGLSTYLTVDLATLTTTVIVSSPIRVASIATDPADGTLIGFGYSAEIMEVTAGSAVQVGSVTGNDTLWGADFATDGSLWATVDFPETATTVGSWTFHPAALDLAGDDFAENITVLEHAEPPAPAAPGLVATGAQPTAPMLGAIALLVIGAGIAAVVGTRRRTS